MLARSWIITLFIFLFNFAYAQVSTRAKIAENIESVFNSDCRKTPKTSFATQNEAECQILNRSEAVKSKQSSQDIEENIFFEYAAQKQKESLQCDLQKIEDLQSKTESMKLIVDDINQKLSRLREIFQKVIQGPGKNTQSRCVKDDGSGKLKVEVVKPSKGPALKKDCLSEEALRKEFNVLKYSIWSGQDPISQEYLNQLIRNPQLKLDETSYQKNVLQKIQSKRSKDLNWLQSGAYKNDEDFKISTVQDGLALSYLADLKAKGIQTEPMMCSLEGRYGSGRKKLFWMTQGAVFAATLGAGPLIGTLSGAVKAGQMSTRAAQIISIGSIDVANAYFSDCFDSSEAQSLTPTCTAEAVSLQKDIQKGNCAGALMTSALGTIGSEVIGQIWKVQPTVSKTAIKPIQAIQIPNVEGDRLKVVDAFVDSNGQKMNVAIDKKNSNRIQAVGFEANKLNVMTEEFPRIGQAMQIKNHNGKLSYPADSDSMNFYLKKYYDDLPTEYQSNLQYYDVDGQIAPTKYLENWVQGKVPYARNTREHFHDVNFHLPGYAVIPKEVATRSQKSVSILLDMKKDPVLSKNKELMKAVQAKIKEATQRVEQGPSDALTLLPRSKDPNIQRQAFESVNSAYKVTAYPYFRFQAYEGKDMNLTPEQERVALEYVKKMKEHFEEPFPNVAEQLLNHPVLGQ